MDTKLAARKDVNIRDTSSTKSLDLIFMIYFINRLDIRRNCFLVILTLQHIEKIPFSFKNQS
jgi:hypothetical protein